MDISSHTKEKYRETAMSVIMLVFSIKVAYDILKKGFNAIFCSDSFYPHEFYINYQGGFVRRGLLGEIIFQFCNFTSINPQWIVAIFCLLCFVFVIIFFVRSFQKEGLCWWILPLSIFLGNDDIVRKDYFFIISLIIILYIYRSSITTWLKVTLINICVIITLLSHEAFFFVCVPIVSLMILKNNQVIKTIPLRIVACIPMYIAMISTIIFHGDISTAQQIQQSWIGIIPGWKPTLTFNDGLGNYYGSIGSLAWSTDFAYNFHTKINFLYTSFRIPGYILRPLAITLIIYFTFNYITYFSSRKIAKSICTFLCIFIFQLLSLFPLFTFLSCDTRRICFYWLSSSFAFFLTFHEQNIISIFPQWYVRLVIKIRLFFLEKIPSNRLIVSFLIFFMCAPYGGNNIRDAFNTSVIMQLLSIFQ